MSWLSRLLSKREDDRTPLRPLWARVVELGRAPDWYSRCGVADTIDGRFDAITLVLALVLLRMERDPQLVAPSVTLSEIFVEDMEGQLRQRGIGDLVVGKHVGKLMGALGGRLGALREALPLGQDAVRDVVARNLTMREGGGDPNSAAARVIDLWCAIDALSAEEVLGGRIPG